MESTRSQPLSFRFHMVLQANTSRCPRQPLFSGTLQLTCWRCGKCTSDGSKLCTATGGDGGEDLSSGSRSLQDEAVCHLATDACTVRNDALQVKPGPSSRMSGDVTEPTSGSMQRAATPSDAHAKNVSCPPASTAEHARHSLVRKRTHSLQSL